MRTASWMLRGRPKSTSASMAARIVLPVVENVVDQDHLLLVDGERDLGALHTRLVSRAGQVVPVESDVDDPRGPPLPRSPGSSSGSPAKEEPRRRRSRRGRSRPHLCSSRGSRGSGARGRGHAFAVEEGLCAGFLHEVAPRVPPVCRHRSKKNASPSLRRGTVGIGRSSSFANLTGLA